MGICTRSHERTQQDELTGERTHRKLGAEIVVHHPKTFGIKLKPMNEDMAKSRERWFPIFQAKFQGELKDILLNTSEHSCNTTTMQEPDRGDGEDSCKVMYCMEKTSWATCSHHSGTAYEEKGL